MYVPSSTSTVLEMWLFYLEMLPSVDFYQDDVVCTVHISVMRAPDEIAVTSQVLSATSSTLQSHRDSPNGPRSSP